MHPWKTAIVASMAAMAFASPAFADTHVISRAGPWEAFGGTTTSGRPVCGVSSSSGGRYFGLKYFNGDSTATIQLGSNKWKIENKAKQKLELRFDANKPWYATGTGFHFNDGDAGLEFTIKREEIDEFMREFRDSSALRIDFTGSDASAWSNSLSGTSALVGTFQQCVKELR
jgi:hypothetical protein